MKARSTLTWTGIRSYATLQRLTGEVSIIQYFFVVDLKGVMGAKHTMTLFEAQT